MSINAFAQNDIVLKNDGQEMIGNVTQINNDDVNFTYKNEKIPYVIAKNDIHKITFSSGRIEYFNKDGGGKNISKLGDHHNKVAILPFSFVKDQGDGAMAMSKKIQQETYAIFNKKKNNLQYQDVQTTNALLIKAGITGGNKDGYTMGEICDILGVEYVIQGMVSVERTGASSYSNSNSTISNTNDPNRRQTSRGLIGQVFSTSKTNVKSNSSSSTSDDFSTAITMNIYNDKGDNIFNQDHSSFWSMEDAYKITLNYLAKKTPLYTK